MFSVGRSFFSSQLFKFLLLPPIGASTTFSSSHVTSTSVPDSSEDTRPGRYQHARLAQQWLGNESDKSQGAETFHK